MSKRYQKSKSIQIRTEIDKIDLIIQRKEKEQKKNPKIGQNKPNFLSYIKNGKKSFISRKYQLNDIPFNNNSFLSQEKITHYSFIRMRNITN